MTDELTRQYVRGLLQERSYAVAYGDDKQIAEIDAELARVGHKAATPAKRAAKRVQAPAEER